MMLPESDNFRDDTERAIAERLVKLALIPVDTSRLDRALLAQIPRPQKRSAFGSLLWLGPMRALAASLLIVITLGAIFWSTTGGSVLASAADMVQLHRDMLNHPASIVQVDSMEQASKVLADRWPQNPGLPEAVNSQVMACCMHSIKDRKVACVLFREDGHPVTMSVARSTDLHSPQSPTLTRKGRAYHVESSGQLNMVSTQTDGRWICLIGELSVDRLIEIAGGLRFE